jgi:VWFA-related protein
MKPKRPWPILFAFITILSCLLSGLPPMPALSADARIAPQAGRRAPARPRPEPVPTAEESKSEPSAPQSGAKKEQSGQKKPAEQEKPVVEGPPGEIVQLGAELVSVPVVVFDKKGNLYTALKKENFTVYEDGIKQEITTFSNVEAPITMVVVIEFSKIIQWIRYEVIDPLWLFTTRFMKPGDYIAVVAFDIRPKVLNDFTSSSAEVMESARLLDRNWPAFSESNLFDTLKFVLQGGTVDEADYKGLVGVRGRTSVLLVATGLDTFSKINYDEARKIVANSGVPIYSIGVGELAYLLAEPYLSGPQRLDFLQAQNQLRTFSESTGGRFYSVRFQGALPSVLESISAMMRNEYVIGYTPTNTRRQGKQRKIKVEVDINGDGAPDNKSLEVQYRTYYIEPKDNDKKK